MEFFEKLAGVGSEGVRAAGAAAEPDHGTLVLQFDRLRDVLFRQASRTHHDIADLRQQVIRVRVEDVGASVAAEAILVPVVDSFCSGISGDSESHQ